ncbi:MAG: aminotransferase class I/II-fold pyridoxal phosphate-dependent enzyme [Acidobacteriota bacterium]|jgi:aspartate aminotransferase
MSIERIKQPGEKRTPTIRANRHYQPAVNLNLNVRGLPESATLEINERSAELSRRGRHVYRLGLGQSPFPVPEPIVEKLRVNAHQKDYLPVKGLPTLRAAAAEYFRRTQQIDCTQEECLIGPGTKELMFILQLVYYGDLVIPTPSWVSYAPQAHIIGRQIRWLPTRPEDEWRLTPDAIASVCKDDPNRPRILVVNYPNNPSGVTYNIEQLRELAREARKYRVILLSDEIYGELDHEGRHISIARFYPEGTIVSSGLSKWCGAGGWRLGGFLFPRSLRWLLDAMAVVASETYTSTSAPIQYAAVRAFQGGIELEEYLAHSRRILKSLGRSLTKMLQEAGAQVPMPEGAFYLFPDFNRSRDELRSRNITTSADLCNRLLDETGVAMLPGSAFGCDPNELTARIAYVDFDGSRALAAARQVPMSQDLGRDYLDYYCSAPMEAVRRLCDWLHAS